MTDTMTKAMCEDYGTSACRIETDEIGETVCMCDNARRARGTIKDSGNRTEFETGAVRDVQQGKGRFDLMPLDVMSEVFAIEFDAPFDETSTIAEVLRAINDFQRTGNARWLHIAIARYGLAVHVDLPTLMLDVAKHFENGALKYGEHNWEKGIPISRYIDSALRHLMKDCACETDEDHAAAFVWNCMCAAWTMEHIPAMDDYTLARKTCTASKIDV